MRMLFVLTVAIVIVVVIVLIVRRASLGASTVAPQIF